MRKKKRGQIAILMALLSTTLVIMFGIVVSIGHLVQSKINLQNAVDLAAMSAASWQARSLNSISLVNYRFRQNFKWTLFDLYITQSRFNKGLQEEAQKGAGFDRLPDDIITFGICQQSYGYYPAAPGEEGDPVAMDTDFCRNAVDVGLTIPPIKPSPIPNLNPFLIAANLFIGKLAKQAEDTCNNAGKNNAAYFEYAMASLNAKQRFQASQFAKAYADFAGRFGNGDGAEIRGGPVADSTALETFRGNLINSNLNGSERLYYLNPTASLKPEGPITRYFSQNDVSFAMYAVEFEESGAGCETKLVEQRSDGMVLGYSRNRGIGGAPQNPFVVVLKGSVQPNLLFWPRSLTPVLTAVGSAKPFGSRVGPTPRMYREENPGAGVNFANMSFYPGDLPPGDGTINGLGHKAIVNHLLGFVPWRGPGSGVNDLRPKLGGCGGGLSFSCLARAPTFYEGLFFNAFPDANALPNFSFAFPSDSLSVVAADGNYALVDRGAPGGPGWHATEIAPTNPLSNSFYASEDSTLSSWAPHRVRGDGRGRIGYQIKLSSVSRICEELNLGGLTPRGELQRYCSAGTEVRH